MPERIVARLRLEKSGRGGKSVTVIDGLPQNRDFLRQLATELKKACGAGGTAGDGAVEIQGDRREQLRPLLAAKGGGVSGLREIAPSLEDVFISLVQSAGGAVEE